MEKIISQFEIRGYYNELVNNKFYIDELSPYMQGKIRSFAEDIQASYIRLYSIAKFKDLKKIKKIAEKEGYKDDIIKYFLDRNIEYVRAGAVIKLIDGKINTVIQKPEIKESRQLLSIPAKETTIIKESLRRPVAFCVCLLYKAGKYDITQMKKTNLKEFISINFNGISAQRVTNTLLGYDRRFENEKAVFYFKNTWQFKDDNYEIMKKTYPDDFKRGEELFNKLK